MFSDETLDNIQNADPETFDAIARHFVYWGEIDIRVRGQVIRSDGHGFCGLERKTLLMLLQDRARQLGVDLAFQTDVDVDALPDSDLIVAADGINSGHPRALRRPLQAQHRLAQKQVFVVRHHEILSSLHLRFP